MTRIRLLLATAGLLLLVPASSAFGARTEQVGAIESATLQFRADAKAAVRATKPDARRLRGLAAPCVPAALRLPDEGGFEAEILLLAQADRALARHLAPVLRRFATNLGEISWDGEPIVAAAVARWRRAAAALESIATTPVPSFCAIVRRWERRGVDDRDFPFAALKLRVDLTDAEPVFDRALRRLFQLGVKGAAVRVWTVRTLVDTLVTVDAWATPRALDEAARR